MNPSRRAFFTGSLLAEGIPDDPMRRNFLVGMFLALLACIFPLPLMQEYCGEKLSSCDLTSFDAALKEHYFDTHVEEILYSESPMWQAMKAHS
jgi:hypothetical protein